MQRARQDKERLQNEAEAYSNRIVPTARGEASSVIQEATAYKERVIKEEAIGMYQVVVLEAGSAKALNRWMDEHG